MLKKLVRSSKIGGSYSKTTVQGVVANGFLFVTGQVANPPGSNPGGKLDADLEMGDLETQVRVVMENIKAILEEAGTNFDNVVKRNVYLTNARDFTRAYELMAPYFTSPVASTGVETGLLPTSARIEVDVIAVVPEGRT
jgi:2-iminobutanoate/2-iminopropanoate deaminase